MKRFISKKISVCMALLIATGLFAGCGGQEEQKTPPEQTINILLYSDGFGYKWAEDIGKAYEKKTEGVYVNVENSVLRDVVEVPLSNKSKYDIVMSGSSKVVEYSNSPVLQGYKTTFADISDVFDYKPEGESKTIEEKTFPSIMDYNTAEDGKQYYAVMTSSLWGLTYNTELLKGYQLPRTSNELVELCKELKTKGIMPFIYAGDADYWKPVVYTWWAQYEGVDEFNKFFTGQSFDEEFGIDRYSMDIFLQKGRLYALEAAEDILSYNGGLCHPDSKGYTYMRAQTEYLQGKSAFMATGAWLENEMADSFAGTKMANIDYLKVPIISNIIDKLSTVKDDSTLRLVVDYVDGIGTKPNGVSDADIEIVRAARSYTYLIGSSLTACIPSYSSKIDKAKEFLKYFFTDEAAKIYIEAKSGSQLPITTDFMQDEALMNSLNDLERSRMSIFAKDTMFFDSYKNPLVYKGGLSPFAYKVTMETAFGSPYAHDRVSAYDYYMYDYKYYSNNNGSAWNNMLKNAGISN